MSKKLCTFSKRSMSAMRVVTDEEGVPPPPAHIAELMLEAGELRDIGRGVDELIPSPPPVCLGYSMSI